MLTDFRTMIAEIKSRISCVEYAQRNGLAIYKSGDRCASPLRLGASNKTSFWVFEDHWYDWGGGNGGDVIDLAAALNHGGDKGKAIRELAKLTGVNTDQYNANEWVNYTQKLCHEIQHYHEKLTAEDRDYLHKRNISDDTINRLKIGRTKNGRLCFPYWKNGYICYYTTRYLPGGAFPNSKYMKMSIEKNPMCDHTVWGLQSIENHANRDLLVIAEGAFDALSFEQEGYSVISAITGHFSKDQLPTVLSIAKMFKQVFLVYDNDKVSNAGEKFALKMTRILVEHRIGCIVGSVPPTYKDVSEYYADHGDLSTIIQNATDGVGFLATKITDHNEFETFARRVCRYKTAPQVDLFFKEVLKADIHDADFLKTLIKECKKAPLDDTIAAEILKAHKLLYHPNISFFEYNGKYWESKSDTEIEGYIRDALGPYATGPRLSSIIRVIKACVVTNQLFNMNPVMNFINGTLELLETEPFYHFREHSAEDLCTYCLDYPYDPSSYSLEWNHFIETVTESDGKRMSFLQEFAGYVLFNKNTIQKCAVLVGSGANGKSIFLKTIEKVFGTSNTKHIDIAKIDDAFRAVHLQGAMLNISEEVKKDLSSVEETIKDITSGGSINACYKGKQFFDFETRVKLFLSLNNYPKISDRSDGFTRRLAFVEFPLKFVEVPKEPHERLIDRTLEEKFSQNAQLSAIFNWVLEGYKLVRTDGYITEVDEHKRVMDEFKEDSDPTITFVKEVEITDRVSYSHLYDRYKAWCADNGYKPEPSRSALRLMGKHFKEYRTDIEPYMSNGTRGYQPC